MAKIDVLDPVALKAAVEKYLGDLPSDLLCALQMWYQGLGGQGVPNAAEMTAMQDAITNTPGWRDVGNVRDERFGVQRSYKRDNVDKASKKNMIQHLFKKDTLYKEPDGKVLKVVTSELWNIRCFEIVNGKMTGPMIKIHPESERAKALVEANP